VSVSTGSEVRCARGCGLRLSDKFVIYLFSVVDGESTWILQKRYSQFLVPPLVLLDLSVCPSVCHHETVGLLSVNLKMLCLSVSISVDCDGQRRMMMMFTSH
jgi:hypothetical protein